MAKFASFADLKAVKDPTADEIIYTVPGTGLDIKIVGLVKRYDIKTKVADTLATLKGMKTLPSSTIDATGVIRTEQVGATDDEKALGAWFSACIVEPEASAVDWTIWVTENHSKTDDIYRQIMLASKQITQADIDNAKSVLEGGAAGTDPLDSSSSSSVSKSSNDSPGNSPGPSDEQENDSTGQRPKPTRKKSSPSYSQ